MQLRKKKNKTSGTSFDEGCIAVNISQLLENEIVTNVKTPRILFARPPHYEKNCEIKIMFYSLFVTSLLYFFL